MAVISFCYKNVRVDLTIYPLGNTSLAFFVHPIKSLAIMSIPPGQYRILDNSGRYLGRGEFEIEGFHAEVSKPIVKRSKNIQEITEPKQVEWTVEKYGDEPNVYILKLMDTVTAVGQLVKDGQPEDVVSRFSKNERRAEEWIVDPVPTAELQNGEPTFQYMIWTRDREKRWSSKEGFDEVSVVPATEGDIPPGELFKMEMFQFFGEIPV
ncbi:hypothetical protein L218DRAFT_1081488 [Marasmius fiardii PR-910]|nr:hypothetical protein L218DRAFT_1081488 [Marasmius fiardii PR-910]